MNWNPGNFGGGYNCASCGAWVPTGMVHDCPGIRQPQSGVQVSYAPPMDPRLVIAFERIAVALERLAETAATFAEITTSRERQ